MRYIAENSAYMISLVSVVVHYNYSVLQNNENTTNEVTKQKTKLEIFNNYGSGLFPTVFIIVANVSAISSLSI